MKKLLSMAIILFATVSCNAQKIDVSKVPDVVKNTFEKGHPGVKAKWEKEDGNYEVNFKQNGSDMSLLIDVKGNLVETEMDIASTQLPAAVLSYVKDHYKGKSIKESAKITKADGTVNYEAEVGGMDVIFDVNGKFIKEIKD